MDKEGTATMVLGDKCFACQHFLFKDLQTKRRNDRVNVHLSKCEEIILANQYSLFYDLLRMHHISSLNIMEKINLKLKIE